MTLQNVKQLVKVVCAPTLSPLTPKFSFQRTLSFNGIATTIGYCYHIARRPEEAKHHPVAVVQYTHLGIRSPNVLQHLIPSLSTSIFYLNSTKKRASPVTALRADGLPYTRPLLVNHPISPTPWTQPPRSPGPLPSSPSDYKKKDIKKG